MRALLSLLSGALLMLCLLATPLQAAELVNGEEVQELEWDALMPADFTFDNVLGGDDEIGSLEDYDPRAQQKYDQMMEVLQSAPVVKELDGKMVKIPGFVVPLEGDGQTVSRFFLVPYFGACIHVPPPPSNQIVHVHYEPGTQVKNLYDAIWVTGKLTIETTTHELGASGYSLEAFRIEPYQME
ncbi:DUF3299 domain-containing protein [Marinobacterium arenosum]|uniref:DUF3299 domain-containing protein n=1 Tax=Marinobacterium arenosum TaxID=2862496 RepID=UPI001C955661|nr:DUF3299 domain-containing protein [Marinobacterium arenosum]MBY4676275.1 DUF3299 domain-containing protein [Marinobacterium arenosum]